MQVGSKARKKCGCKKTDISVAADGTEQAHDYRPGCEGLRRGYRERDRKGCQSGRLLERRRGQKGDALLRACLTSSRETQYERHGMTSFSGAKRRHSCRHEWLVLMAAIFLVSASGDASLAPEKQIILIVTNRAPIARDEVIAIPLRDVLQGLLTSEPNKIRVETSPGNEELPTQIFSSAASGPPD